jgi:ATP-binding cassette subfamily F protein 3
MALLTVDSIVKGFGPHVVLDGVTFHVDRGDRVALVGRNGSGKTTLLEIIAGSLDPDAGHVSVTSGARVGYHRQEARVDSSRSMLAEVLWSRPEVMECELRLREVEAQLEDAQGDQAERLGGEYGDLLAEYDRLGGYQHDAAAKAALGGLGFNPHEFAKPVSILSGGEASRVALARLLVQEPDILLLDEPTNHLDIDALEWLEEFILCFGGAVLIVSHDRYFLDRVATELVELEGGTVSVYAGNYTEYVRRKAELRRQQAEQSERQRAEIRRLEAFVAKWKAGTRVGQAKDREKKLAHMSRIETPRGEGKKMKARIASKGRTAEETISAQFISKSYGDRTLFHDFTLSVHRGERIGIIGPNGSGKTTLIDILRGVTAADAGTVTRGLRANIGYLPQEIEPQDSNREIVLELLDVADLTLEEARSILGRFQFTGEDAFKKVGVLSGGELRRLWLAKLVATQPNVLILDEPTNHLDLPAREGLDESLKEYAGTIVFVSHDRYLLDAVATRIVEIEDGTAKAYEVGYSEYRREKLASRTPPPSPTPPPKKTRMPKARLRKKEKKPKPPSPEDIEQEIARIESRLAELTQMLADPDTYGSDGDRARDLVTECDSLTTRLSHLYAQWESTVG